MGSFLVLRHLLAAHCAVSFIVSLETDLSLAGDKPVQYFMDMGFQCLLSLLSRKLRRNALLSIRQARIQHCPSILLRLLTIVAGFTERREAAERGCGGTSAKRWCQKFKRPDLPHYLSFGLQVGHSIGMYFSFRVSRYLVAVIRYSCLEI